MSRRGWFIVLEGIDGSGKSEQAHRLARWLRSERHTVVSTREPTDGEWGRTYRSWARGEFDASPDEVLRWFVADRREHVAQVIAPALERGDVIVCDRYRDSTRAYQAAQGIERARLAELFAGDEFPAPDLVLWLRVPVATALARLGPRAAERFERGDFLARVDAEYECLGLAPVDGSGSADAVELELRGRVQRLLASAALP